MCSPFVLPCVALSYAHTEKERKMKHRKTDTKPGSRKTQKKRTNTKLACNTQHTCEEEVSACAHLASC